MAATEASTILDDEELIRVVSATGPDRPELVDPEQVPLLADLAELDRRAAAVTVAEVHRHRYRLRLDSRARPVPGQRRGPAGHRRQWGPARHVGQRPRRPGQAGPRPAVLLHRPGIH